MLQQKFVHVTLPFTHIHTHNTHIYIYTHTHTHTHTDAYIYTYISYICIVDIYLLYMSEAKKLWVTSDHHNEYQGLNIHIYTYLHGYPCTIHTCILDIGIYVYISIYTWGRFSSVGRASD